MDAKMVSPMECDGINNNNNTDAVQQTRQCNNDDSELALDQLLAFLVTEKSYRVPSISCTASPGQGKQMPYGEWRRKICQWCFRVVDHFQLDREIVSAAMNIFERYLATKPECFDQNTCPCPACQKSIDSSLFQLTAMTSLYLAMKLYSENSHNSPYRKLRLDQFVELSRGQFSQADVSQMERSMLKELQWKVNPPTPMAVVPFLLRLMPSRSFVLSKNYDMVLHVLHELARYLSELSICLDKVSTRYSPSQIAYASILVSMELLTYSSMPVKVRNVFNECALRASVSAGGAILTPHDESIQDLRQLLRDSFWPEMLEHNGNSVEVGHPIFIAREHGLLDMGFIASQQPSSSSRKRTTIGNDLEDSPVSVSRGALYT